MKITHVVNNQAVVIGKAILVLQVALFFWLAFIILIGGCSTKPLRGGTATIASPQGIQQTIAQGENAKEPSRQLQETVKVRSYTVPVGSTMEQVVVDPPATAKAQPRTNRHVITVSEPMPVTEREETKANTELGSAQKDTAREIGAKLASMKGIVWLGAAMFLFGIASAFWLPLKAIVNSTTTSAVIALGGLALMFLPSLIVGNELLILSGVSVCVVGYYFAHRYGRLRGYVDANKDGIDDRLQKPVDVAGGQS